jgi:hypothetical protein
LLQKIKCFQRGLQKEVKETNLVETSSGFNLGIVDEVLSTCDVSHEYQHWLLDYGVCSHMCLHRNWFSTYKSIDDGVVFMGKYFSYKIIGVGSVRIKMHDGSVRTLKYVRHVPKLINNLIYFGVPYSVVYKCTNQGGVMKVPNDILVVMNAKRIQNLYQFEGRT